MCKHLSKDWAIPFLLQYIMIHLNSLFTYFDFFLAEVYLFSYHTLNRNSKEDKGNVMNGIIQGLIATI